MGAPASIHSNWPKFRPHYDDQSDYWSLGSTTLINLQVDLQANLQDFQEDLVVVEVEPWEYLLRVR